MSFFRNCFTDYMLWAVVSLVLILYYDVCCYLFVLFKYLETSLIRHTIPNIKNKPATMAKLDSRLAPRCISPATATTLSPEYTNLPTTNLPSFPQLAPNPIHTNPTAVPQYTFKYENKYIICSISQIRHTKYHLSENIAFSIVITKLMIRIIIDKGDGDGGTVEGV